MISAKIITTSRSPSGSRLTTFELTYPRMIHAEFMTHRCFSRNAASSRAIPITKMLEAVNKNPAMPVYWGANKSGMQAAEQLTGTALDDARDTWRLSAAVARQSCRQLDEVGLHKQIANRVLEPFGHITVIATAEDAGLRNFFGLRAHADAQPEFQVLAYMMLRLWLETPAEELEYGEWHMPYGIMSEEDRALDIDTRVKVATGRIARVSYLTHDGHRDPDKDIELHDRLLASGHMSPFEHCAKVVDHHIVEHWGNFGPGWKQYRKACPNECRAPTDDELKAKLDAMPQWASHAILAEDFLAGQKVEEVATV